MSSESVDMSLDREFVFTSADFKYLRTIVTDNTGIVVVDEKQDMFYSRLARRVRSLGLSSFKEYCDYIRDDRSGAETVGLVNAITTNLTSFFREKYHFEYLTETVFPELIGTNSSNRRLRIWSAGCSTGEEPYSIAVTVCESGLSTKGWDVRILATDVNSDVLAHAAEGVYSMERVDAVPERRLQRWFLKGKGNQLGRMRIKPEVGKLIDFAELNLISRWSLPEPVDIIFCRNVVIYFDQHAKKSLIDRMADSLKEGGYLFLGHSESLFRVSDRFELIGNTIYRKKH